MVGQRCAPADSSPVAKMFTNLSRRTEAVERERGEAKLRKGLQKRRVKNRNICRGKAK